jgi:hypothetical protein
MRRLPLALLVLSLATMLLGTIASQISQNAYAPRYSIVVLPFMLLVLAIGITALPASIQSPVVAALCAFGLIASVAIPFQSRTQAGQVAQVLRQQAAPGDLVVICPDQLGPAVYRLAPDAGTEVVYPTFGSPAMVDWVNYKKRNESADPGQFTQTALRRAAGKPIWLVWEDGYPTFAGACGEIYTDLTAARGSPITYVKASGGSFESEHLSEFEAASTS